MENLKMPWHNIFWIVCSKLKEKYILCILNNLLVVDIGIKKSFFNLTTLATELNANMPSVSLPTLCPHSLLFFRSPSAEGLRWLGLRPDKTVAKVIPLTLLSTKLTLVPKPQPGTCTCMQGHNNWVLSYVSICQSYCLEVKCWVPPS